MLDKNRDNLTIAGHVFHSRLFLGTGKFSSNQLMSESIKASGTQMVTIALKRVDQFHPEDDILEAVKKLDVKLLPNTSGARTAKEAVLCAELCREAFETNWLKLEIHPDPKYLLPDPIETLKATEELAKKGFIILPYIHADPVLCKRLEDVGTSAVMPLGAPIGTNRGLETKAMLNIIMAQSNVPVIVDAGIGRPSHAAEALEIGADAVLVNTAIAVSADPIRIALAFRQAVEAGSIYRSTDSAPVSDLAQASSPFTEFISSL